MSHRLLSAAAARLGASASTPAIASTTLTAPPAAPAAPAPAASTDEAVTDVVTLADAQAAVAAGEARGATAERERTAAVFASAEGKAHPQMAAFMLSSTPGATSDQIVAHLKAMPAASAAPAAPAAETAPVAPAAAITHDLNLTPKVEPGAAANSGDASPEIDPDKFWKGAIDGTNASMSSPFGADIAPGLPRTGN